MRTENQITKSRLTSHLLTLSLLLGLALFSAAAAQAGSSNKVNVCHMPPGNPGNWHTITISEKALSAHLNHGDLAGTCESNCGALCDDGNPCTQDVDSNAAECACLSERPPVDCDDGSLCTADSCDAAAGGCINAPIDCNDGNLCTVDSCDGLTGSCVNPPLACGFGEFCDLGTGSCVDPCDGVICEPLDQCHVAGSCTNGSCSDPIAVDGVACDDGDPATGGDVCTAGVCAGTANQPQPGEPGWVCPNPETTEIYADVTDCVKYIACQLGNMIELNCNLNPADRFMRYDPVMQQCVAMGTPAC